MPNFESEILNVGRKFEDCLVSGSQSLMYVQIT